MNSLEKILAYQNMKPFLAKDEWEELGRKIGIDNQSLRRTRGKSIEDTFFLIAYSYETVENIMIFNEGMSKLTGTPSADGLVILRNGDKLLIEVKATEEKVWKISRGRVDRQVELSKKIGIDLYYAISMHGYWGLFQSNYINSNGYKIEFPTDLRHSLFESKFDAFYVKIPKGLTIVKYYSPKVGCPLVAIEEPGHGYLYKYQLIFHNIHIDLKTEAQVIAITAVEAAFFDNYEVVKESGEVTRVTHVCEEDLLTFDFNLIMEPILRTKSTITNDYFDSSSFILHTLDALQSLGKIGFLQFKRDIVRFLTSLKKDGIPFDFIKQSQIKDVEYRIPDLD